MPDEPLNDYVRSEPPASGDKSKNANRVTVDSHRIPE